MVTVTEWFNAVLRSRIALTSISHFSVNLSYLRAWIQIPIIANFLS